MEPRLAENLDPQATDSRPSRARSIVSSVGPPVLGLALMALAAGSAWWIRGRVEVGAIAPAPASVPVPVAWSGAGGAQPDRVRDRDPKTTKLKVGRLAYQVHCARCHGHEGRGDGADAAVLRPPPRDFSARPWTHGESPEAVRSVILQGVPGTSMTGWGHLLSEPQLDAVIDYVRTLGAAPARVESDEPRKSLLRRAGFEPVESPIAVPSITYHDLQGRARTLEQDRGRAILLVFWGTTCAPCVAELPALDRLAGELGDDGLVIRPICVDESDAATVGEIARTHTQRLPLFVDRTGLARLRYDLQSLPCAVLVDGEGRLLARAQGGRDWLAPTVQEALRAVAAPAGDSG